MTLKLETGGGCGASIVVQPSRECHFPKLYIKIYTSFFSVCITYLHTAYCTRLLDIVELSCHLIFLNSQIAAPEFQLHKRDEPFGLVSKYYVNHIFTHS